MNVSTDSTGKIHLEGEDSYDPVPQERPLP